MSAKANKALDAAEKPDEMLDYSYEQMLDQITKVRQGLVAIAGSRKQIELQEQQLQHSVDHLQDQAKAALAQGREDLAREALSRKAAAQQAERIAQLSDDALLRLALSGWDTAVLLHNPTNFHDDDRPFADRIDIPRQDRAQALDAVIGRFAARVEHYIRVAPYNWFNFYDFWQQDVDTVVRPDAVAGRKRVGA